MFRLSTFTLYTGRSNSSPCHLCLSHAKVCCQQSSLSMHIVCTSVCTNRAEHLVFLCVQFTGVKWLQVLMRRNRLFLLMLVRVNFANVFLFIAFVNPFFIVAALFFSALATRLCRRKHYVLGLSVCLSVRPSLHSFVRTPGQILLP